MSPEHTDESLLIDALLQRYPGRPAAATQTGAGGDDTVLGDFRLLREIGRGGMGVVFEAEQVSLRRRVAVKVLHREFLGEPERIARFRREVEAIGRVRHPSVVPIHLVAEDVEVPYFAMEFVEGVSLAEFLADLEKSHGTAPQELAVTGRIRPGQDTWVTEAAEIVAQAAEGLGAAHAEGLIHRDVKPANLLLGNDGKVRVVDFGLARELDAAALTRTGDCAGTPRYMSPEQFDARASLDARGDVFSLGVVLYELLTLRPPFDGDNTQQILRSIALREPRAPRQRNPRVPRDLETICLTALEKEPERRYADAAQLAADLRRFLNHEPIVAEPPGPVTRVTKFVRRHRAATTAAILAFLLVVVGPLAFGLYMQSARDALRSEQQATLAQRNRARDNLHRARGLLTELLEFVAPMRTDPEASADYERVVRSSLSHYSALLTQAEEEGEDTPAMLREMAGMAALVAKLHGNLGEMDAAIHSGRTAVATGQRLVDTGAASPGDRFAQATSLHQLARDRMRAGEDAGVAEADTAAAVTILEDLRATRTDDWRLDTALARMLADRSLWRLQQGGRRAEADVDLDRALELFAATPERVSGRPENLQARAAVHADFCEYLHDVGDLPAALDHGERAVEASRRLHAAQPSVESRHHLATSLMLLGAVLTTGPDPERGGRCTAEAVEITRGLVAACPREVEFHGLLAGLLFNQVLPCIDDPTQQDAVRAGLDELVPLVDRLVDQHPDRSEYRIRASEVHDLAAMALSGDSTATATEAIDHHQLRAIAIVEAVAGRAAPDPDVEARLAGALCGRAHLLLSRGDAAGARDLAERAATIQRRVLSLRPGDPTYRAFLQNIQWVAARAHLELGEAEQAAAATETMLEFGDGQPMRHDAAAGFFARCAAQVADPELAERLAGRAVEEIGHALDKGWRFRRPLAEDPRFARLQEREDFTREAARVPR